MSSDDGQYVHDPATLRDDEDGESSTTDPGPHRSDDHTGREEFGTRGWVLVGVLVVCLFVVPGVILVRPPGLPWEVSLLVFPLLPALLLGGAAIWSALGGLSGSGNE